jgi:accessory colonization factor AcfC
MSKNSARQNAQTFIEWLNWAKTKYPELKKKRKQRPEYMVYNEEY